MRYAIIADVHANIEALDAVLDKIDGLSVDRILCCGDLVGYYADPNECIDRLRERGIFGIRGNHDMAAAGAKRLDSFWEVARHALSWTRRVLREDNRTYLQNLPATAVVDERLLLFHGALHPDSDAEDLHLENEPDIRLSFEALLARYPALPIACFGHVHVPLVYRYTGDRVEKLSGSSVELEQGPRYLINPGSVGQPRDGDARPSFAVYDAGQHRIEFYRAEYAHAAAQAKARAAGLLRPHPILAFLRRAARKFCKWVGCADVDY